MNLPLREGTGTRASSQPPPGLGPRLRAEGTRYHQPWAASKAAPPPPHTPSLLSGSQEEQGSQGKGEGFLRCLTHQQTASFTKGPTLCGLHHLSYCAQPFSTSYCYPQFTKETGAWGGELTCLRCRWSWDLNPNLSDCKAPTPQF